MADQKNQQPRPRVFVGSSREALDVAYAVQQELDFEADVTVWTQGIFELTGNALDDLISTLQQNDYGVFVFTPDDIAIIRDETVRAARDNVIFELGLFLGRLGKQRTFFITPRGYEDFHLPSDLTGVTPGTYKTDREDSNLRAAIGPSCHEIKKRMRKLGRFESAGNQVITPENPKEAVLRGAKLVESVIGKSYGPHGTYTLISVEGGGQLQYKRGSMLAGNIRSNNLYENKGIGQMARVSEEVFGAVGDFSKTAVLLAHAMVENGQAAIARGLHPKDLVRGMEKGLSAVYKFLSESGKVVRRDEVIAIARTAAGGDETVARLIADAMNRVGKDGRISVVSTDAPESSLVVQEGLRFDRGYLSPHFVTDEERDECVLEDCHVLLHDRRISSIRELIPLLEEVARLGKPLLIIADDVDGEALATLVLNKQRGTIKGAAVRAPSGDSRREYMEDIAVVTGAKVVSEDLGIILSSVEIEDLGRANRVIISKDSTTILGGAGTPEAVEARANRIRARLQQTASGIESSYLGDRLAKLAGAVAVIYAGGVTEIDVVDQKYKIGSALNSAYSAVYEGWVAGGGKALLEAKKLVDGLTGKDGAEQAGLQAVSYALEQPTRRLIESVKPGDTEILERTAMLPSGTVGFNVENRVVEDLVDAGVLDPVRSLRVSLEVAFSHAQAILQTGEWDVGELRAEASINPEVNRYIE